MVILLDHGCQLLPTLQMVLDWAGMVLDCGHARPRAPAKETSFFQDREAQILTDAAHLLQHLPFTCSNFKKHHREILVQNLWACTTQSSVTRSSLMEYIKHRKRLDVEQAVAMVLAFVPPEVGSKVAPLVSGMFPSSNMWRTQNDFEFEGDQTPDAARERKLTRLRDAVMTMAKLEPVDDDHLHVMRILMRVRRERSALSNSQRLCIPKYLITLLPEDERDVWSESYASGIQTQVECSESVINATKTQFARMQRWLSRLDGDNSKKAMFMREVRSFEKEVYWEDSKLEVLEKTDDPVALAFSFMAVQRRLQLKVVSVIGWTEFLKKGQGREVLQNRPGIVTSFEEELARHATDVPALVAIRPPASLSSKHYSTLPLEDLIDKACTLMEQYVLLFGNGRFENLRYYRIRKEGWKGRGPEDVYNLLVDLLAMLQERGDGRFFVGPCHKFLAKDIMHWNNSWANDAFAPGKIPGWVDWLQARQKLRIRLDSPICPKFHGTYKSSKMLSCSVTAAVTVVGLENVSPVVVRKRTRHVCQNAAFARLFQPRLKFRGSHSFRCPLFCLTQSVGTFPRGLLRSFCVLANTWTSSRLLNVVGPKWQSVHPHGRA